MTTLRSPSDILKTYPHTLWGYVSAYPEKAYNAECPTIADCIEKFGPIAASLWIQQQVTMLFGTSSNKDKGVADGIELFCDSFAGTVRTFKLSELMLFFSRYKAGNYDNSYSSFDARRIGCAFKHEFLPERDKERARMERNRSREEIEKRRFTPPEGYSSLSWYRELKRRAAEGDMEAARMLEKP